MKTRFKGHESFYFREGWLSKALFEINVKRTEDIFYKVNGIRKLGVGSNMVKSIKYWLITSGLMKPSNNSKKTELTDLGELVSNNDMYFEDIFTLWLIHINIVLNYENATTWNLFFSHFDAEIYSTLDVKNVLKNYLEDNSIKFAEKSLDADINVLLNMYAREKESVDPEENYSCPLNRLGLIVKRGDSYQNVTPILNDVHELVVFYAILCIMNKKGSNHFISISDLETGENSLSKIFNFNRIIINEYLEQLASQNFIRIDKTAGLDMVYIVNKVNSCDVVRMYYDRRELYDI